MTTELFEALSLEGNGGDYSELNQALTLTEEDQHNRRQQRMSDCGHWANWFNPHTGGKDGYIFRCGYWRECASCLRRRAERESKWVVQSLMQKKNMVMVEQPVEDFDNFLRRNDLTKNDYVRFPQENSEVLLISADILLNDDIEVKQIGLNWVKEQDWQSIVNTPEGRNKSGRLHIIHEEPTGEEFSMVDTLQFVTNASRIVQEDTMQETIDETLQLNPETPAEVENALNERAKLAVSKLRSQGYAVRFYRKRVKLIHGQLNWKVGAESNALHTENSALKQQFSPQNARASGVLVA
jgi:hypothetical protein